MGKEMKAIVAVLCALALAWPAWAADMTPAAQKEIAQLLERIETSNCSFNRNGSWYGPQDARKHLQRKLDYMVERKMLGSAEDFIADAATSSSMSGKPYLIRCGSGEATPSADWLRAELRRIRAPS
jgi:Family of unknown function (DUF5329)